MLKTNSKAHLNAVHTPWNPSKYELKNRERMRKKLEWMKRQCVNEYEKLISSEGGQIEERTFWNPTPDEVEKWGKRVLELTALAEAQALKEAKETKLSLERSDEESGPASKKRRKLSNLPESIQSGHDRTGKIALSYRESLPPFLQAASTGKLEDLKNLVTSSSSNNEKSDIINSLIYMQDRNGSTAEHWAAGGGHINCLEYLLRLKKENQRNENLNSQNGENKTKKKMRRRDGKTSLHYASRNGHVDCIKLILEDSSVNVDEKSGDGTTPLHMACYGGKLEAIKFLVQKGANVNLANSWGCNASHWIAMNINDNHSEVIDACNFLYHNCQLPFHTIQNQGHSAVHKAAQRKNLHIIKWMADSLKEEEKLAVGQQDDGGNCPSDILESFGGDKESILWMKKDLKW